MSRPTSYAADTQPIRPEDLYSMDSFIRASGITRARMREARQSGIELTVREVGKRKYVYGRDAIAYILALAELSASPAS